MLNIFTKFLTVALAVAVASPAAASMRDVDRRLKVALSNYFFEPEPAEAALAAGADINARDSAQNDETLLIMAIKSFADPKVVEFLMSRGADPGLRDGSGKSALDWAIQYGIGNKPDGRRIVALLKGSGAAPAAASSRASAAELGPPASARRTGTPAAAAARPAGVPASPPAPGVYECINQQAMISPIAFGIIDGSTYMSSGGRRGRYSYDPASGILSLDPGANPARYKRISATTFRLLKPDGTLGGFTCPLNRAKSPTRPPW